MPKKIYVLALTFAMVLSLMPAAARAEVSTKPPEIYVDMEATEVKAGSGFDASVKIRNNPGLGMADLNCAVYCGGYDVTKKFICVKDGTWAEQGDVITNNSGRFRAKTDAACVMFKNQKNNKLKGDGTLFTIHLTPGADLVDGPYTIKIALADGGDGSTEQDSLEGLSAARFSEAGFTLAGGISGADVTPAVSVRNAAYTFDGSELTAEPLTAVVTNVEGLHSDGGTGLVYRWYRRTADAGSGSGGVKYEAISGAEQATYTPELPEIGESDTYKCVVTSTYNGVAYTGEDTATVTYSEGEISGAQAIGITAPVRDEEPVNEPAVPGDAHYTGTTTWSPTVQNNRFAAGTAYTANVTLTAAQNYKFDGVTAAVNGAAVSEPVVSTDGKTFTFRVSFGETASKNVGSIAAQVKEGAARTYEHGDELDRSAVTVTATYDDGTVGEITDYTVQYSEGGAVNHLVRGQSSVTIVAGGVSATLDGLQVDARKVKVAADDKTITAGDALPAFTTAAPAGVEVDNLSVTCPDYEDRPGEYTIRVTGDAVSRDGNYKITYEDGILTVIRQMAPAGPGGSVSASNTSTSTTKAPNGSTTSTTKDPDGSTTTSTTRNPDGSTTTRTENRATGTVTETVQRFDGSTSVVETEGDGTVITTNTDPAGIRTQTVARSDGSRQTTTCRWDGSSSTVAVSTDGRTTAEVKLSAGAARAGTAIRLPIPAVEVAYDTGQAPVVTVRTAGDRPAKVEIPVAAYGSAGKVSSGTVAVLVRGDGTEEIIRTSVLTGNGITLTVNSGDRIKVVDRSKTFTDTGGHWGQDAIDFVSARELFQGTGGTEFSPDASMTRGMLMTVLARFDGVDTSGPVWYEKGVAWAKDNGLSDGANQTANISREQLVTILYRYAVSKRLVTGLEGDLSLYRDADQVDSWARNAMSWAVQTGILNGIGDALAPAGDATRAQVAAVIERYARLFAERSEDSHI